MRDLEKQSRHLYGDACAAPLPLVNVRGDPLEFSKGVKDYVAAWHMEAGANVDESFFKGALEVLFDRDSFTPPDEMARIFAPSLNNLGAVQRLARLTAHMNGGAPACLRLWSLFLDGVNVRWESKTKIDGIDSSTVDLNEPILHQKLQMINCCIARCAGKRNGSEETEWDEERAPEIIEWDNAWDCDAESSVSSTVAKDGGSADSVPQEEEETEKIQGLSSIEGVGRARVIPGMYLISLDSDEKIPVYEPELQDHPLLTSDIAAGFSSALANPRLTNIDRARLQSASLTSDMSAFKAANPKASLEDFVRWFSPSDHVPVLGREESSENTSVSREQGQGEDDNESPESDRSEYKRCLSERMSTPGNLWEELWAAAPAIPAFKQNPIFDAEASALKALSDLRAMTLTQVVEQLTLVLASEAISLLSNAFQKPPRIGPVVEDLGTARMALNSAIGRSAASEDLIEFILECEKLAFRASALTKRIPEGRVDKKEKEGDAYTEQGKIIGTLCKDREATVKDVHQRRAIGVMAGLDETDDSWRKNTLDTHEQAGSRWRSPLLPHAREFVFEAEVDRANYTEDRLSEDFSLSETDMDRMYVRVEENDFRVGVRLNLDYNT